MSSATMSKADEFRKDVKAFWSNLEPCKAVATNRKAVPTGSSTMPRKREAGLKLKKQSRS